MTEMPNECWLTKHPRWAGCCCVCRYRVKDYDTSTWTQRGWACVGFLLCEGEPIISSGLPLHGCCELFERVKEVANA